jgi:hypothetical protein
MKRQEVLSSFSASWSLCPEEHRLVRWAAHTRAVNTSRRMQEAAQRRALSIIARNQQTQEAVHRRALNAAEFQRTMMESIVLLCKKERGSRRIFHLSLSTTTEKSCFVSVELYGS